MINNFNFLVHISFYFQISLILEGVGIVLLATRYYTFMRTVLITDTKSLQTRQ